MADNIEYAITQRLLADANVSAATGGKIFFRQAPESATLPWVTVTNSGGMPVKISMGGLDYGSEKNDTLTLYISATTQIEARNIAQLIYESLHNYRGDLTEGCVDTFLRVGSPRDLDGWNGALKELVSVYCKYRIQTNVPT